MEVFVQSSRQLDESSLVKEGLVWLVRPDELSLHVEVVVGAVEAVLDHLALHLMLHISPNNFDITSMYLQLSV